MNSWRLGKVESQFADLIWSNAPITSGDLAKLALQKIGWKKTTSYTVLKRLCDRGLFRNDCSDVYVVVSREDYFTQQAQAFVKETFSGSLPAFLSSYFRNAKPNRNDIEDILEIIDRTRR